ncbi:hypothetical protein Q4596_00390 [Pseudoalteromonas carrageenovora]|uniref:hypothetical protein n=1 Tax=Pseudoalteromonas carrageenovora TaxID=227 RepID=UPI0026E21B9C|nr:hypothetical protein [Pseudoalteromonas carrageenovora]MDO6834057.1 hypothetical protein [Pseudoalteromonas carrageenovora]
MNSTLLELDYSKHEFLNYSSFQSYIDMQLLPLVINGDFNELDSAVVAINKHGKEIFYSNDFWPCTDIFQSNESSVGFHFSKLNSSETLLLKNQLKCLAIALLYTGKDRTLSSSIRIVTDIRKLSLILVSKGIYTLDKLDLDLLIELADEFEEFTSGAFISSINTLILTTPNLPLSIQVEQRITSKVLDVELKDPEQYMVIPPRIYKTLLTNLTLKLNDASLHIEDIVHGCKNIISCHNEFKLSRYNDFLEDRTALNSLVTGKKNLDKVIEAFNKIDIDINSGQKPSRSVFIEVLDSCRPQLSSQHYYLSKIFSRRNLFSIPVGDKKYQISKEFIGYVSELANTCRVLILAYTGMRINELKKLSPNYAIQRQIIDGQTIYKITTRQSKIAKGVQTKNDVFVTNEIGYKAAQTLNTIMQVFRENCPADNNSFNISLKSLNFLSPMKKTALAISTNKFLSDMSHGVDLNLTMEDIQYLAISDPGQTKAKESQPLEITNHMFRRSLAYYLIGYELLAFPMLKQQLSHMSSAMTRWYANNASSFQKLHTEIQNERVTQQSKIYARVFQKIANNERIAGGKGKAITKLLDNDKNYYEESTNNRVFEESYWASLIRSNKAHLHAILPGMYCSNSKCDMRVSIELAECVDCEFDLIEEVTSIEAIRINSMKNILVLHEANELSHSSLSYFAMKIKSAEKILDDMDFDYEPFEIPDEILKHIIQIKNI